MNNRQQDRQQLNDLVNGWMHRDLGEWAALRQLFHPDGTIEITWFEGLARDFVDGSMRMGASDLRTKHLIGTPVITFNASGNKAILETNAMIIAENVKLNLGCECHNRFYDRAEKRDGVWRLFHATNKLIKRLGLIIFYSFSMIFPKNLSISAKTKERRTGQTAGTTL